MFQEHFKCSKNSIEKNIKFFVVKIERFIRNQQRQHTNPDTAIYTSIISDILKEHMWVDYTEEEVISDVETKNNFKGED